MTAIAQKPIPEIANVLSKIKVHQGDQATAQDQQKQQHMEFFDRDKFLDILDKNAFPKRHAIKAVGAQLKGKALETGKAHLDKILKGDCLFILSGDRGVGKTQIATWWAFQRIMEGKDSSLYAKTNDVFEAIKNSWSDKNASERAIIQSLKKKKYLVLDEAHLRRNEEWDTRILTNLIDHRYDAMLTTVLIINRDPAETEKELGRSIIDRANETGGVIYFDFESYRDPRNLNNNPLKP